MADVLAHDSSGGPKSVFGPNGLGHPPNHTLFAHRSGRVLGLLGGKRP